jgi:hypothetical protein
MITLKFGQVVDPMFLRALNALKSSAKLPMLHVKKLDKILEVLQRELDKYTKDTDKQREEAFGAELTEAQKDLLLHFTEEKTLDQRFRDHGYTAEQEAEFREKFKVYDEYCTELGKQEIRVAHDKLKLPDTFELAYDHAKTLSDIINLE